MNTRINPELWNTLSSVQKRAVAENITVEKPGLFHDLGEVVAWTSTFFAVAVVVGFADVLLH